MLTFSEKLSLLLWKNWWVLWYNRWQTILSIVLPPLFGIILVIIRFMIKVEQVQANQYDIIDIDQSWFTLLQQMELRKQQMNKNIPDFEYNTFIPRIELCYAPVNYVGFNNIIAETSINLQIDIVGYANCEILREKMRELSYIAGICFDDIYMANISDSIHMLGIYPNQLSFSLIFPSELRFYHDTFIGSNWRTDTLYELHDRREMRMTNDVDGSHVDYIREGFIAIQNAISTAYLRLITYSQEIPHVFMSRFPFPPYTYDPMDAGMQLGLSMVLLVGFLYPVTQFVSNIVHERQNHIKIVMEMNGVNNFIQFCAWCIEGLTQVFISSILILIVIKVHWSEGEAICTKSSISVLLFVLFAYNVATVCFCYMMSTFFLHTFTAVKVTGIFWILTYLPYVRTINELQFGILTKILTWICSNATMGLVFDDIFEFEQNSNGIHWSHLLLNISLDEKFSIGAYISILFGQSLLYTLVGMIMEILNPTSYGMPKYSTKNSEAKRVSVRDSTRASARASLGSNWRMGQIFEVVPELKRTTLEIRKLTKKYHGEVVVNEVSLNLYENEITILMGHNGSGKTTLICMIVGLIPRTEGTIVIDGYDLHTRTGATLGICVKRSVLFDELTVLNQLKFFSRIKGLNKVESDREVYKYLTALQMHDKKHFFTGNLSKGLKQHLAVCCALVGGSKVVILDEPDTGMDMGAIKLLCEMLLEEKKGRTILMTTHSIEFAELMADRVAIMSSGELKCNGSIHFLKKIYSDGYRLTCIKARNCVTEAITEVVEKYIPNVRLESDIGFELSYLLEEAYIHAFPKLLDELEEKSYALNLESCAISETPLADVFYKLGAEDSGDGEVRRHSQIMNGQSIYAEEYERLSFLAQHKSSKGIYLILHHWKAMMLKRFIFIKRYRLLLFLKISMPILFICLSFIVTQAYVDCEPLQPMTFRLTQYPQSFTLVKSSPNRSKATQAIDEKYRQKVFWMDVNHKIEDTNGESLNTYLVAKQMETAERINNKYLIGASFYENYIVAWFNNYPLHTAPLSLNAVHNAMVHHILDDDSRIMVTLESLPSNADACLELKRSPVSVGNFLAINVAYVSLLIFAGCVIFVVKERQSRFKLLQFISGIRILTFWMTAFTFDWLQYVVVTVTIMITILLFRQPNFLQLYISGWYFMVLLLAGLCIFPVFYLQSTFFKNSVHAYATITALNGFGIACLCSLIIMEISYETPLDIGNKLEWLFRLFPYFSLTKALVKIFNAGDLYRICMEPEIHLISTVLEKCNAMPNCCVDFTLWSWDMRIGIIPEVMCLIFIGTSSWILLGCIEYFRIWGCHRLRSNSVNDEINALDDHRMSHTTNPHFRTADEVVYEKVRVVTLRPNNYSNRALVCDRIAKFCGNVRTMASFSLVMERSECFYLLGANGCGKTTLVRMLVGDLAMSCGKAFVDGISIKNELYNAYRRIGYCPQQDALLSEYTAGEIMEILCLLRGIPSKYALEMCESLAKVLGFFAIYDKRLAVYSEGNKRRLSCAIAMLGNPSLVLLDEPTAGIDPAGRRQFGNILGKLTDNRISVLMATVNTTDCQRWCHRLGILSYGHLMYIGSLSELRNKYAGGYLLKVKIKSTSQDNSKKFLKLATFVETEFLHSELKETCGNILVWLIPLETTTISRIFEKMQRNTFDLSLEYFNITRTTLSVICIDLMEEQKQREKDTVEL